MHRLLLAALACLAAAPALAQPVTPDALRRHIEVLASDSYEGREPGTEGERKTIAYISRELASYGLEPAGPEGSWYQPLEVKVRRPAKHVSVWRGRGKRNRLELGEDRLILLGRGEKESVAGAPVVFAGHGAVIPDRGIDQLAGIDLQGAVVLILYDPPAVPNFPAYAERVKGIASRGAAAVIGILGKDMSWAMVQRAYAAGQNRLAIQPMAPIQGAMSQQAAEALVPLARTSLAKLLDSAPGPSFRPVRLKLKASLEVESEVRTTATHNVVGRLRGSAPDGKAVMFLGHWDHLGICQPEAAEDRICNGAVDNASGIAVMLESARALAKGPRPKRDILFLATTAEEMGLLGAEYFAARPPIPLESILAAFNLDTVAIAPKGQKVAVIGRGGVPSLDAAIDAVAAAMGRSLDMDDEAAAFVQRQDGWALARAGVPAVMVGGSFSDVAQLRAFLQGPYHGPDDDPDASLILDGAAEDADLLIALARRVADPARYPAPPAAQAP
jgi:Zn-dependent M28 family amino/carboxypeptidase